MISHGPDLDHLRTPGMVVGISAGLEGFKEKTTKGETAASLDEKKHEQRRRRRVTGELGKKACGS